VRDAARAERRELRATLSTAVRRLPERDRTVVLRYCFEPMTLSQIGEVLGASESRVSRLYTGAVLSLRAKLGGLVAARDGS
jgi:RNA polymerase sigma factor for flagellar operon FliA